jgi:hypothetical protein
VILSVAELYPLGPLGMARIEAWMMPWIAVLVALTLTELGNQAAIRSFAARLPRNLAAAAVAVVGLALVAGAARATVVYPTTRAREALRTITPYKNDGFAFVANHDFPIDLVAPGPIRVVENAGSTTNYSVELSGFHGIHANDPLIAAYELDRACGSNAAIVGVDPKTLTEAFPHMHCQVLTERVNRRHTSEVHDDTVILRLGPRAH